MLMTSHSGTGVITILADVTSDMQTLIVDFISSELTTRKDVNLAIKNLVILRDFRSILKVEQVEPYLKIAKILANKLGWRLEFDFHQDYKFRLMIPITNSISSPNDENLSEDGSNKFKQLVTSVKSFQSKAPPGTSYRPTRGAKPAAPTNYDISARRPHTTDTTMVRSKYSFNPVREYPILEDSHDSPRATSVESFRTFQGEKQHCASILLLNAGQNLTEILKEKFAIKADDSFTVESALSKIKKSLFERKACQCPPYTHLIIDFERDTKL
jgi:hypothetical protein